MIQYNDTATKQPNDTKSILSTGGKNRKLLLHFKGVFTPALFGAIVVGCLSSVNAQSNAHHRNKLGSTQKQSSASSEPNAAGGLQCRALWVNATYKCTCRRCPALRSRCARFLVLCSSHSVTLNAAPPQAKEGNTLFKRFWRSASCNSNHVATTFEMSLNQKISVKNTRGKKRN